jgi:hypothetical protein
MVDKHTHKIDHVYFEKFKAKGANGWGGANIFSQMGAA